MKRTRASACLSPDLLTFRSISGNSVASIPKNVTGLPYGFGAYALICVSNNGMDISIFRWGPRQVIAQTVV